MSVIAAQRAPYDIAIVGGGFSGLMVAINAATAAPGIRIALVERRAAIGRGTAYAQAPAEAILNVPAAAMGAFPDRPDDFARWVEAPDPGAYLPRQRYGDYLHDLLRRAQAGGASITCLPADIVDVRPVPGGRALIAAAGEAVATAALVVLAIGAPRPADPVAGLSPAVRAHPGYVADPWAFLRAPAFPERGGVLVIGSGLTALDVIAAFARSAAPATLHVVSRRGRFPLAHGTAAPPIAPFAPGRRPASLRAIVRDVRDAVRTAEAAGADWRRVMDGLRPLIGELWRGLDAAERRRFLRHVRPLFDPHRHRAPAALLAHKDALAATGRLTVEAARIGGLRCSGDGLVATLLPRGGGAEHDREARLVVNCAGPANDYASSTDPLVATLLARGEISVDPIGIGLRAHPDGRLIDAAGTIADGLFTIGWPMRGTLLESTAVRELRQHAADLGRALATAPARRAASDAGDPLSFVRPSS